MIDLKELSALLFGMDGVVGQNVLRLEHNEGQDKDGPSVPWSWDTCKMMCIGLRGRSWWLSEGAQGKIEWDQSYI